MGVESEILNGKETMASCEGPAMGSWYLPPGENTVYKMGCWAEIPAGRETMASCDNEIYYPKRSVALYLYIKTKKYGIAFTKPWRLKFP